MNNQNSLCALNTNNTHCLPADTISVISSITIKDSIHNSTTSNLENIIIPKISKSLGCNTNLNIQQQELCILNTIKKETNDSYLEEAIEKQKLKYFKIPTKSLDKNYWLNNTEIDNVQFQLQNKYNGYYYSTIHMIDLVNFPPQNNELILNSDKIYNIKDIDFVKELTNSNDSKLNYNGKLKNFGMVCNTDVSTNGGIHWFSIFIDFTTNPIQIEYFNSSGYPLTRGTHLMERKKFYEFFQNIADEMTKQGFQTKFIQVTEIEHQRSDTANCGSYSLFYLWSRLKGKEYTMFKNNKITDEMMEKFRSILWRKKN